MGGAIINIICLPFYWFYFSCSTLSGFLNALAHHPIFLKPLVLLKSTCTWVRISREIYPTFPPVSGRCNESAGHGQMMDVETSYSDFINCDRTGRRNAVPDITGEGSVEANTSELTKDLAEMDLKAAGQYSHISWLQPHRGMEVKWNTRKICF